MNVEFLRPHFEGPRFAEHTLPVDVARDLAVYEEIVIELARHLFLLEHQGRQRVPKGWEEQFNLHVERLEGGSARPVLSCVTAAGMLFPSAGPYFEQARDVIAECIRATADDRALPANFPKHLLARFNVFGRSLREGESVDLAPIGAAQPAVLDPNRRKQLVLQAQRTYERDVPLAGKIEEVDWQKQSFRLRLDDGSAASVAFTPEIEPKVREAGGLKRTRVSLLGTGVFDAYEKLQRVSVVKHLDSSENHSLATQLEALEALRDGWLDGSGNAPVAAELERVAGLLVSTFPPDLPLPFVCPTPDGGVFLEWEAGDWTVSAEFAPQRGECELQAVNSASADVRDEDLPAKEKEDFAKLYAWLRQYLWQFSA